MKLYTAEELAAILKVHVETVRRWGREGKIKRIKVGSRCRYMMPEPEE